MPNETDSIVLRSLYSEILRGFSIIDLDSIAYIRHLCPLEQGKIDEKYLYYYDLAEKQGLLSDEAQAVRLKNQQLWSDQDQTDLENQKVYIEGLYSTKSRLFYENQVNDIKEQIKEAEKSYAIKYNNRVELFGLTAEVFASRKLNEANVYYSIYKDQALTTPYFTEEGFNNLDYVELKEIIETYNAKIGQITSDIIKKIALEAFFQNCFSLCDDNIYYFYGKPLINLSYFQSELAIYGRYFKRILSSDPKPPDELLKEPDKLIEWYSSAQNAPEKDSGGAKNVSLINPTDRDLKIAGGEITSLSSVSSKQGKKTLTIEELIAAGM